MQEFLSTVTSFPTIVFSAALAVILLYWLIVIFGALDLDFLDSVLGLDTMDAAFEGGVEALEGAADAAAEGAAEAIDADASDGSPGGLLTGLLNVMGVRGVPLTIVGTFVVFWAWLSSYLATRLFGSLATSALFGLIIAAISILAGGVLAAMTSRPLRKLFTTQLAPRRASLVGKMCTILSARVGADFGRGEIEDGGAGFVAEVRCPNDNDLVRGSKALVYRYEPEQEIFFIGPVDQALTDASQMETD